MYILGRRGGDGAHMKLVAPRPLPSFFYLRRLYVGYKELHKRLQRVTKGTIRKGI